jgi:hypothetical protein
MKTRIILSQINLNITINRLLFRLRKERLKDEAKANIEIEIKDLDYVKATINELEYRLEQEYKLNTALHLDNIRLKKQIDESQKKEIEI